MDPKHRDRLAFIKNLEHLKEQAVLPRQKKNLKFSSPNAFLQKKKK
jgi:peptide chain release factor 3